jgi:alpha-glucosidase (family GH31 glycosyl hydrolase)
MTFRLSLALVGLSVLAPYAVGAPIQVGGKPGRLAVRAAGEHGVRITLMPADAAEAFPFTPGLADGREYPDAAIQVTEVSEPVKATVAGLNVEVGGDPLAVTVTDAEGRQVQKLTFAADGALAFAKDDQPILGMGEGGPLPGRGENWRESEIQFDRNGSADDMRPRWQATAYGSRNPVALLVGTSGWGMYIATPWGAFDLRDESEGKFTPWQPPAPVEEAAEGDDERGARRRRQQARAARTAQVQGRPPEDGIIPGAFDVFVFDAKDPTAFMNDVAEIGGRAVMPPKWSLGYMQSHRTLRDEKQLTEIVDTFREKKIPVDSVVYLGTGFCPVGWNKPQPSYEFNPELFDSDPKDVLAALHDRHVKVVVHVVPFGREQLATIQGTVPAKEGEPDDNTHIANYWKQYHEPLFEAGVDAFWPDEGDWFNLFERIKRHQLYHQGPLSTRPNVRPWSLHRNGHLGVAKWGGWVWSGDTQSSWKTLEGQVAVGINHSLSLGPYWGSDIGGFYPNRELTGELYARWFQFGAFCPSFRSHGRTWWTRLPWGWGLSQMGPREDRVDPFDSELNNPAIEPVCRKYAELRYQLMPYTYTLARQARDTGLPLMRALWLHYPDDAQAAGLGSEYLWGRDLLVAPVFTKGATSREVYLPAGQWYDWWTNERHDGGQSVTREVDLATMPLYVRAGGIIPFDPVRQYTAQEVDGPTTLRIYTGADGEFTLYEDDGESLEYLDGEATWTRISWDDDARQLVIEPGSEPGHEPEARTFRVELLPEGKVQEVEYGGERVEALL